MDQSSASINTSNPAVGQSLTRNIEIIREENLPGSETPAKVLEFNVLYENQRGLFFFGQPKFSAKALNQLDPSPWTDENHNFSATDIHTTQLPDPSWEWVHKEWMVDMSGDVDEEGWEYAFNFYRGTWHGNYEPFRSFVRRRRWIRLRRLKNHKVNEIPPIPERTINHTIDDGVNMDLFEKMKISKLDRERLVLVEEYLDNHGDLKVFDEMLDHLLQMFDHQESRRKFLEILVAHGDKPVAREGPSSLVFFSDVKDLLETMKQG